LADSVVGEKPQIGPNFLFPPGQEGFDQKRRTKSGSSDKM
jgi:hypothetical protein